MLRMLGKVFALALAATALWPQAATSLLPKAATALLPKAVTGLLPKAVTGHSPQAATNNSDFENYMSLRASADLNGDGQLTPTEAAHFLTRYGFSNVTSKNMEYFDIRKDKNITIEGFVGQLNIWKARQADKNKNGHVTPWEFAQYLSQFGLELTKLNVMPYDENKDSDLSSKEIQEIPLKMLSQNMSGAVKGPIQWFVAKVDEPARLARACDFDHDGNATLVEFAQFISLVTEKHIIAFDLMTIDLNNNGLLGEDEFEEFCDSL